MPARSGAASATSSCTPHIPLAIGAGVVMETEGGGITSPFRASLSRSLPARSVAALASHQLLTLLRAPHCSLRAGCCQRLVLPSPSSTRDILTLRAPCFSARPSIDTSLRLCSSLSYPHVVRVRGAMHSWHFVGEEQAGGVTREETRLRCPFATPLHFRHRLPATPHLCARHHPALARFEARSLRDTAPIRRKRETALRSATAAGTARLRCSHPPLACCGVAGCHVPYSAGVYASAPCPPPAAAFR
ncbi:hypothetical protein DFH09DRAFT_1308945 [Mycena vulgaris]|nr:hypothetical protein DFH09DRAFT_1308945 [Mycena vulgaris]